MKVRRTPEEIRQAFNRVVRRLRRASMYYDRGQKDAAGDLVNCIRILLHHNPKGNAKAALWQLGKDGILFFGTPNGLASDPKALLQFPLVKPISRGWVGRDEAAGGDSLHIDYLPVYDGITYDPAMPLRDQSLIAFNRLPFDAWWNERVLALSTQHSFSRLDLVMKMADQDYGRHIDSHLDVQYAQLDRHELFRATVTAGSVSASPDHNLNYPVVRQIAYELQRTLDNELSEFLDEPATTPPPPLDIQLGAKQAARYERNYLERVLEDLKREGDAVMAEIVRRQIFWET